MKKALIIIDYQYDFVAEDGLLTAGKNAQNIENEINERIEKYLNENQHIIFTLDTHIKEEWENHPESNSFCLHCEKGTKGHKLFGKIEEKANLENTIKLEKKAYCLKNKDLENIINEYDEIELLGVVTDICVLQTGIGLYNTSVNLGKNVKISVFEKGCASFNEEGHKFAIDYMKNILGFNII
ncbi:MAG: cysteine hydrolase [Eubacteriales bacterium]|nr:cysteine hydrolase [Eubacteriales bacterium]